MLQALGIVYSKIVLPSSDVKGETKGKTYCPTTWNYSYQWQYAAEYADLLRQAGASSLLCQECTLSVIAQLSNKSASHPNCVFADSASAVMSGVMVSPTPLFKSNVDRPIAFHEYAELNDVNDMIQKLNVILSIPKGFPQSPAPRKECRSMTFPPDKRNGQYVMCPEQDCECLVYYGDQSRSMIDVLGLGQDPFWDDRVKDFYGWYSKSASKTGQDAWTWEGKDTHKWPTTRGASKRNQSQPIQLIAQILRKRQFHGETLVISTRTQATSIQANQQIQTGQLQRMTTCAKKTSSSICSGSSRFLILIEELPRILDCIVRIVT